MARTTKSEIREHGREHRERIDEATDATRKEAEGFQRAAEITDRQGEPVLQETAETLNALQQRLGEAGMSEVNRQAEVADAQVEATRAHGAQMEAAGDAEKTASGEIAAAATGLEIAALRDVLAEQAEARKEGGEFLESEAEAMRDAQETGAREVAEVRGTAERIRTGLKQF